MFLRPEDTSGNAQTEWLTRRLLNRAEYVDNRRAAAQALGRGPDACGLLALTTALDDSDAKVREHARTGLATAGWVAAQHLHPRLTEADPEAALAARALGLIAHPSSREALRSALHDPRPAVAVEAAIALGCLGELCAVEPLCALLAADPQLPEEANTLRLHGDAARALGTIGDPRAVDTLCRCLRGPEVVAEAAAQSLGTIGNPWAVEPLTAALERVGSSYHTQRSALRRALYQALGQIPDPRVVRPLCHGLSDLVPAIRQTAAASLHALSDEIIRAGLETHGGSSRLQEALGAPENPVVWQAVRAAGLSARAELLPALRRLRSPWSPHPIDAAAEQAITAIEQSARSAHPIPAFPPAEDLQHLPIVAEGAPARIYGLPLPAAEPDSHEP